MGNKEITIQKALTRFHAYRRTSSGSVSLFFRSVPRRLRFDDYRSGDTQDCRVPPFEAKRARRCHERRVWSARSSAR